MQSLQGKLIMDGGKLAGSVFSQTVVLVCTHDPQGAFGLVLNRRTEHDLGEALAEAVPAAVRGVPLYWGGPVSPQGFSCLVRDPELDEDAAGYVLPELRLVHTLEDVASSTGDWPAPAQLKCFAGYAGWAAGQLDNEMKQAAWLTHPATIELVFHPRPAELWKSILRTKGPRYRLLAESPEDVSRN